MGKLFTRLLPGFALAFVTAGALCAQPAKILYLTTSAGFRHGSIGTSAEVLRAVCSQTRLCEVTHTEDTGAIESSNLGQFRAVLFFTSGELPLSASQKQALLDFVARGGAFCGIHSATDTLYTWAEYGQLIGAYFDGHPWAQAARMLVQQPDHRIMQAIPSPWTLTEEYYQFRNFETNGTQVLLSLDKTSVDLNADGVKAQEFPLTWTRTYGGGRVFYTALGHFDETWRDATFQRLLANALAWMLAPPPRIAAGGVGNAATLSPPGVISPGSLISIYGSGLTDGPSASATIRSYPMSLAGTTVTLSGRTLPLLYAGPNQINAFVPFDIGGVGGTSSLEIRNGAGAITQNVSLAAVTPGIFTITAQPGVITIWGTGFGTERTVRVSVGSVPAEVSFAGMSPEFEGLFQVNASVPSSLPRGSVQRVEVSVEGAAPVSAPVTLP